MLIPLHLIVRELCWHPDLRDRTIKLWNVESRTEVATLKGHSDWVNSVAFNSEGTLLASGSDDRTIKLWNVESRTEVATLKGHSD